MRGEKNVYSNDFCNVNNKCYDGCNFDKFIKKIPLSDIRHIEFETFRSRGSYSGKIIVNLKNAKVIKRYFQTSKMAFFVSEQMVLAEIEKITPILKKYYIPYSIKNN